ncbi:MAG: response regulator transcription factor [Planctomycetaceae bacterium]|jgi:two-component system alkaline phosphatase synthesis response regulator PhoP|nr:response regulator transcription factor [Planctomycetaceae bacterium]
MSTAKAQVLIVEDEPEIAELIEFHAERAGMKARKVGSGRLALDLVRREQPDLIVLDLMLPDVDGLEVCRKLKQAEQTRSIPIVMVTAKGEEADIVAGIELGAADYVTKPFSPRVLVARLRNALRRAGVEEDPTARIDRVALLDGKLVIDIDRHEVAAEGRKVDLTLTEFGILHYLATRPGFVRTRDQIIAAVHGKSTVLSSRTVDVHVTALRRKLGALADCVETVRGVGYRFADSGNGSDD